MTRELIVDSFAGGGGASTGIEWALGRSPDIAINHSPEAIAMQKRSRKAHPKHGLSYTPEYRAWQTMRLRCTNPANPAWKDYGGRGITVCAAWLNDPAAFVAHIGPKPSPRHELDRIDNERGYEPGNVRWVPRKVNCRNRRSNVRITIGAETLTLAEWCERNGVPRDTARKRIEAGWPPEDAVRAKPRPKRPNGAGRHDGRRS